MPTKQTRRAKSLDSAEDAKDQRVFDSVLSRVYRDFGSMATAAYSPRFALRGTEEDNEQGTDPEPDESRAE